MLRTILNFLTGVVLLLLAWEGCAFESASPQGQSCSLVLPNDDPWVGSRWKYVRSLLRTLCHLYPGFTRPLRKRALLIGISYRERDQSWWLRGTHSDVKRLRRLLIRRYGFRAQDITVMVDREGARKDLWPTENNIRRELSRLTKDCALRDRFVLLYAGHAGQKPELFKHSEADGFDEFIVPCDADDMEDQTQDLYKDLIKPLKPRSRFIAIIDACHSGTLLDLTHDKCLSPDGWIGIFISALRWAREWISNLFGIPTSNDDPFDTLEEQADADDFFPTIPALERLSNSLRFCQGLCRRVFQPYDPWVICFSACKDAESAIEMKDVSMTKVLVRALDSAARRSRKFFLEELLSIARANMAADFSARWQEHLRKRAMSEAELCDPSFNPSLLNPSASGRPISLPDSIPIFFPSTPYGPTTTPRLFFSDKWRWLYGEDHDPEEWPAPAKLQMTSNAPRFTNLERFWI
ncbi:caspase domain-containing protein [Schizophyllum commune]